MKKVFFLILILALAALAWWYYASSQKTSTSNLAAGSAAEDGGQTLPPGSSMETGTIDPSVFASTTPDTFTVRAYDYGFSPSSLSVKKGDHVVVTLTDAGGLHDFVIDEMNVKTSRLDTSASTTIEFDATKAGTFQYYSSVGNDRANGMWGNITVTP